MCLTHLLYQRTAARNASLSPAHLLSCACAYRCTYLQTSRRCCASAGLQTAMHVLLRSVCQPAAVALAQSKAPSAGLGNLLKYINVTTRKLDYATVGEVPLEKMHTGERQVLLCQCFYFFLSSLLVFSCLLCLSCAQEEGGHPEMRVRVLAALGAGCCGKHGGSMPQQHVSALVWGEVRPWAGLLQLLVKRHVSGLV